MTAKTRPTSIFREFLDSEASGGLVLMAAAALALIVANSPLAPIYFQALQAYLGPLSIGHWINDGLMAVFFLLVGLEIKREALDGQLSTWPRRVLPGLAAAGGMAVPALIYVAFNAGSAGTIRGWASFARNSRECWDISRSVPKRGRPACPPSRQRPRWKGTKTLSRPCNPTHATGWISGAT